MIRLGGVGKAIGLIVAILEVDGTVQDQMAEIEMLATAIQMLFVAMIVVCLKTRI